MEAEHEPLHPNKGLRGPLSPMFYFHERMEKLYGLPIIRSLFVTSILDHQPPKRPREIGTTSRAGAAPPRPWRRSVKSSKLRSPSVRSFLEPQSQPERNGWNSPVPTISYVKDFKQAILEQPFVSGCLVWGSRFIHVQHISVVRDGVRCMAWFVRNRAGDGERGIRKARAGAKTHVLPLSGRHTPENSGFLSTTERIENMAYCP